MSRRARSLFASLCLALVVASAGCGYRLAGTASATSFLPEDARVIGIPLLGNRTEQADIDQRITEALLEEFVRRGDVEAVPSRDGVDVLLEGEIWSFREEPIDFTAEGRFSRVEVLVTARIRLVRTSPETILWSQNNFVFREQYDVPESPTTDIDRQIVAIDEISSGFARSVVTSILEGF